MDDIDFSRVFHLNELGDDGVFRTITASVEECQHLASLFELLDLGNFTIDFHLVHGDEPQSYVLRGEIKADIVQACVVTLRDVPNHLRAPIHTILLPRQHKVFLGEQEMAGNCYYEPLDGDCVDLGEIAAQCLSSALPIYSRHPSALSENHNFADTIPLGQPVAEKASKIANS
ncbi:MAG: hypothetical protein WCG04_04425 [Alphaproteobacteria bacterium]